VRCACLQAVFDLEATNAELKSDLRDLYITKAEEIDGKSGRKAIIIHVRFPCQCKGLCRVRVLPGARCVAAAAKYRALHGFPRAPESEQEQLSGAAGLAELAVPRNSGGAGMRASAVQHARQHRKRGARGRAIGLAGRAALRRPARCGSARAGRRTRTLAPRQRRPRRPRGAQPDGAVLPPTPILDVLSRA